MTRNIYDNVGKLITISFVSSLVLGMGLLFYAIFNDYIFYQLYQSVLLLQNQGAILGWVGDLMVTLQQDVLVLIPNLLDLLWVITFIAFVVGFMRSCYFAKREGYLSVLSFLNFGLMIILFVLTIFIQLSTWFQTEVVVKALPTLAYLTPFFSLYLTHAGLVNLIIIALGLILNFVDLELNKFNFRKSQEKGVNELT